MPYQIIPDKDAKTGRALAVIMAKPESMEMYTLLKMCKGSNPKLYEQVYLEVEVPRMNGILRPDGSDT